MLDLSGYFGRKGGGLVGIAWGDCTRWKCRTCWDLLGIWGMLEIVERFGMLAIPDNSDMMCCWMFGTFGNSGNRGSFGDLGNMGILGMMEISEMGNFGSLGLSGKLGHFGNVGHLGKCKC